MWIRSTSKKAKKSETPAWLKNQIQIPLSPRTARGSNLHVKRWEAKFSAENRESLVPKGSVLWTKGQIGKTNEIGDLEQLWSRQTEIDRILSKTDGSEKKKKGVGE